METKYQVLSQDWENLLKDYNTLSTNHKKLYTECIAKKKEYDDSSKKIFTKIYELQNKVNELEEEIEGCIRDYDILHRCYKKERTKKREYYELVKCYNLVH